MSAFSQAPFSLQGAKARLKVAEKELKSLQWEHEVLEQRFIKVSRAGTQDSRRWAGSWLWKLEALLPLLPLSSSRGGTLWHIPRRPGSSPAVPSASS